MPLPPCSQIFIPNAPAHVAIPSVFGATEEMIEEIDFTLRGLGRLGLKTANTEVPLAKPGKWFLVDVFMQAIIPQQYFEHLLLRGNVYIVIPDTLPLTLSMEGLMTTKIFKDAAKVVGNQNHLTLGTGSPSKYLVPYLKLLFPTHLMPFGVPLSAGSIPISWTHAQPNIDASDYLPSERLKKEIDELINFYTQHIRPLSNVSKLLIPRNGGIVLDIPTISTWGLFDLTALRHVTGPSINRAYVKSRGTYLVMPYTREHATQFSIEDLQRAVANSRLAH